MIKCNCICTEVGFFSSPKFECLFSCIGKEYRNREISLSIRWHMQMWTWFTTILIDRKWMIARKIWNTTKFYTTDAFSFCTTFFFHLIIFFGRVTREIVWGFFRCAVRMKMCKLNFFCWVRLMHLCRPYKISLLICGVEKKD